MSIESVMNVLAQAAREIEAGLAPMRAASPKPAKANDLHADA
jgi:hypothetical protein